LVSHTQSFKGGVVEEGAEGGKGKKGAKGAGAKTTVQSINAQVEKATLGDLDSLARLKEEMEGKE